MNLKSQWVVKHYTTGLAHGLAPMMIYRESKLIYNDVVVTIFPSPILFLPSPFLPSPRDPHYIYHLKP